MRAVIGCAVALVVAVLPAVPATAAAPSRGDGCDFVEQRGEDESEDAQTVIWSYPVRALGATVTVTCSLQLNDFRHEAPDYVVETSAPRQDVAMLEPRVVVHPTGSIWDLTVVCTSADVDGVTWYLTPEGWTTDPASRCGETLPEETDPVVYVWSEVLGCYWGEINPWCEAIDDALLLADTAVCDVLRAARPGLPGVLDIREDGDTYVAGVWVWECPPYWN